MATYLRRRKEGRKEDIRRKEGRHIQRKILEGRKEGIHIQEEGRKEYARRK